MAEVHSVSTRAFDLEVITPERILERLKARSLQVPTTDGLIGILAGHAPLVSTVAPGVLRIVDDSGKERKLAVGEGFVEVAAGKTSVLVDSAERPEQIDVERAQEAKKRAEDRLAARSRGEKDIDFNRAQAALLRAIARLKVTPTL